MILLQVEGFAKGVERQLGKLRVTYCSIRVSGPRKKSYPKLNPIMTNHRVDLVRADVHAATNAFPFELP